MANVQLTDELFIDDLSKVTGGAAPTNGDAEVNFPDIDFPGPRPETIHTLPSPTRPSGPHTTNGDAEVNFPDLVSFPL